MTPEFLAFRYQGVRRIDEILAKPSDIAWKCRKYIKWREVHDSPSDAKALYAFADDLLERGKLRKDLYGAISAVCLNVQKWRLDKETLSIDPPPRKEWEKRDVLFKAARNNPSIIRARLSELHVNPGPLSNLATQILFYACELDSFFRMQNIEDYPAAPLAKSLLAQEEAAFAETLLRRFGIPYQYFGITPPQATVTNQVLDHIATDLGFEHVALDPKLTIPAAATPSNADAIVELRPLEKFRLIQVDSASGIPHIRVNSTHPFVASLLDNGKLDPRILAFLKAYGSSMLSMAGSLDTLEAFNSHLGLDLYIAHPPDSGT